MSDTDTTGVRRFRTNFNEWADGLLPAAFGDIGPQTGDVVQLYEPDPPGEIVVEATVEQKYGGYFLARPLDSPRREASP